MTTDLYCVPPTVFVHSLILCLSLAFLVLSFRSFFLLTIAFVTFFSHLMTKIFLSWHSSLFFKLIQHYFFLVLATFKISSLLSRSVHDNLNILLYVYISKLFNLFDSNFVSVHFSCPYNKVVQTKHSIALFFVLILLPLDVNTSEIFQSFLPLTSRKNCSQLDKMHFTSIWLMKKNQFQFNVATSKEIKRARVIPQGSCHDPLLFTHLH